MPARGRRGSRQSHGGDLQVDGAGQILGFFEALPRCLVGMEACATYHYWARELTKLGHQLRLMPAKDVKAYVEVESRQQQEDRAITTSPRRTAITPRSRAPNF
jgi:transposase